MDNYDTDLTFLLADCTRLYGLNLDRRLRNAGMTLSRSQWRVIAHLTRSEGITQTELAELLGIEKAPLGTLLEKLEKSELIERRCSLEDKRAKRVYLTQKGRDTFPLIREQANILKTLSIGDIPDADIDQFVHLLQKIKSRLLTEKEQSQLDQGAV